MNTWYAREQIQGIGTRQVRGKHFEQYNIVKITHMHMFYVHSCSYNYFGLFVGNEDVPAGVAHIGYLQFV